MSQVTSPSKPLLEKSIIAVIDVPWLGANSPTLGVSSRIEGLVGACNSVSSYDLDIMNASTLSFQLIEADEHLHSTIASNDVNKMNALIYNKTMNALRHGQIPAIIGGSSVVTFASIEAATKKVAILDVLNIGQQMNMKNSLKDGGWDPQSAMFNVAARISNVSNIVHVGVQNTSEEEMDYCDSLNMARTKNDIMTGMLSGIGKTYPKAWIHFDQDLIREQFQGKTWLRQCNNIAAPLREWLWVSIDLTVLNNKSNVLNCDSLIFLLRTIVKNGHKIIGFDLTNTESADQEHVAKLLFKTASFAAISQGIARWQPRKRN